MLITLLGGLGTVLGPVIGAFMLVFITQVVLARLLDFLNSLPDRFVCVVQPDRLVLVNRQAIAHVHELN